MFRQMPLIKITGQGLYSIAALTAILWGCLIVERLTIVHARADGDRALEQIRALQLKKGIFPAAAPASPRRSASSAIG
jgi:hypothetical protein